VPREQKPGATFEQSLGVEQELAGDSGVLFVEVVNGNDHLLVLGHYPFQQVFEAEVWELGRFRIDALFFDGALKDHVGPGGGGAVVEVEIGLQPQPIELKLGPVGVGHFASEGDEGGGSKVGVGFQLDGGGEHLVAEFATENLSSYQAKKYFKGFQLTTLTKSFLSSLERGCSLYPPSRAFSKSCD